MRFKIGQRVIVNDRILQHVYVDNCRYARKMGWEVPEHGKVYTIRGGMYVFNTEGYVLEEIINPQYPFVVTGIMELHFNGEIFSPVITRSASMEALMKLQDPANHKVFRQPSVREPLLIPKKKVKAA